MNGGDGDPEALAACEGRAAGAGILKDVGVTKSKSRDAAPAWCRPLWNGAIACSIVVVMMMVLAAAALGASGTRRGL